MKKILTIIAIFMTMLCSSALLVSCSKDSNKVYLTVEYALPTENGQDVQWVQVDAGTDFDYVLSQGVYSSQDEAHILYLRVNLKKGASKKVTSLYVSQTANTSTFLDSNTVKPNEAFKVKIKNFGSVRFTITPNYGGAEKAVTFGVNIYKELTSVSQNPNCVPAVVTGGYVAMESLTSLIDYTPAIGETNQTGVNYTIEAIGALVNDGSTNLIGRTFVPNDNYTLTDGNLITNNDNENEYVNLDTSLGSLMLNVSTSYKLTTSNNVIKLRATSVYHEDISTEIYLYIVENFKTNSLLVSYSPDIVLNNGNIPTDADESKSIGSEIIIYNSAIDATGATTSYNAINVYTYTNASIYSYETNPGMKLNVEINGAHYDYFAPPTNNLGVQVSPVYKTVYGSTTLIGLKFEVNPNAIEMLDEYKVRLELDFTAFDFSASDKTPTSVLNKEFTIKIQNLASGIHINGRSYSDNIENLGKGVESTITEYDSTKPAKLYTTYSMSAIGMPLNIQATPTNAIDTKVYVGFYESYSVENGQLVLGKNLNDKLQLLQSASNGLGTNDNGLFEIDFYNKNKIVYLAFNDVEVDLKEIYMVCKVVCTPDSFGLEQSVVEKYITFVATIDVVGAIENMYVYKNYTDSVLYDTYTDKYVANATDNIAYINFSSNASDIDLSQIKISSLNGNIKYSADGLTWNSEITADDLAYVVNGNYKILHFRTENETTDSLIISSPNGVAKQIPYQFVNVTSGTQNVKLEFDTTYIENLGSDKVGIDGVTATESVDLNYLALQAGRTVQFKAYGDNKSGTIESVQAKSLLVSSNEYMKVVKNATSLYANPISTFSASAIRVSNTGTYVFDVSANSVGFTAILFVKVDFYVVDDGVVVPQSKYFVYEVAVYTPAKDLTVVTDKDDSDGKENVTYITYINENYPDVAKVNFTVMLNAATRSLTFSSQEVNEKINVDYGTNNTSAIYGIRVQPSEYVASVNDEKQPYFVVTGLNSYAIDADEQFISNASRSFSVQALRSLYPLQQKGIESISFDIVVYQFGKVKETTKITKVVYFGSYNKAETITIESGVDNYSNIYLSLLGGEATHNIVAYSTNEEGNVTYGDLGYTVHKFDETNNTLLDYNTGSDLSVVYDSENNTFTIKANNKGGVYQLKLFAKDSYDNQLGDYKVSKKIKITVSDGKTEATAYLIKNVSDFETLAENTNGQYYRLWQTINISALSDAGWWQKSRQFEGVLDGAMTIEDPNTGKTIYRCYSLQGLRISKNTSMDDASCFGLFNVVSGTIKNIVFEDVKLDITLNNSNTSSNSEVNIGVITAINNGVIENCSVNMDNSSIIFATSAQNTIYNIGLVAGENNEIINYSNTSSNSNFSHMINFVNSANAGTKLSVIIEQGNTNLKAETDVNIGGVAGKNTKQVKANYVDKSSKSISELISAIVNIEVQAGYNASNAPMKYNSINIGGVAGCNEGDITNIAISGSIKANDKVNIGGVVGSNAGVITEVANFGACLEGYSWNDTVNTIADAKTSEILTYSGEDATVEQNIGGVIGKNNAKNVDNVRVMFITFDSADIAICPNLAHIKGVGNVAGVIGKAVDTKLTRAYVENFVTDTITNLNYNIIGITSISEVVEGNSVVKGANVAGLVATVEGNTSAYLSFVQADFSVLGCEFYEFGKGLTYGHVYSIGDVLSDNTENSQLIYGKHNEAINSSYIVSRVVYTGKDGIAKYVTSYGTVAVSTVTKQQDGTYTFSPALVDVQGFKVAWLQSAEEGVNSNQPYLVYVVDNSICYTLTVQPTDIIVNADEKYFDENVDNLNPEIKSKVYDNGIYLQYIDDKDTTSVLDDTNVSTAIVYYYEGQDNTHKLVSDDASKGLIEKTVLPTIADGAYSVSIVTGSNIATITSGGSITFNGVGKVELKFVSLFDRTKSDIVTIFVENPISEDVFEVKSSAGLEDRNQNGERLTTRVGVNSLLNLKLTEVGEQTFDNTKTYMTVQVGSGVATTQNGKVNVDDVSSYFTINPVTQATGKGYGLGQLNVSAKDLDTTYNYIEIPVTFNVYLNLYAYGIEGTTLNELMDNHDVLLKSKTITIIIYNKATALTVSSDVKSEAGTSVTIEAKLTTGYVDITKENSGYISTTVSGELGNKLLLDIVGQDKIELTLTAENKNAQDLLNNAKLASGNENLSIWELFETYIQYKLFDNKGGFTYNITLLLKDEYRYLSVEGYTEREWKFNINIIANSNNTLSKDVKVSFVPQSLISFRLENYSNLVAVTGPDNSSTIAEFKSSQSESSLIIPSESGLVKIYADYNYSYFENITISSSRQTINGVEYFIRYQQMVYNKVKDVYESYAGITAEGETLALKKISYSDGTYDGVIFVRTILDDIVGVRKTFTITVNADTYNINGDVVPVTRTKTVISQYRPGVYVNVDNAISETYNDAQIYLVEQNSSTATVVARVYGYEFNIQPNISIIPYNEGDIIEATDVNLIQQGAITQDISGAYIIKYTLAVNTNKPFRIQIKMTLLDNGNTLTNANKELVFFPVPYIINNVYVRGEANGGLSIAINTSKTLELVWSTNSTTNAKINAINQKINELNFLDLFYINQINASGQDYNKKFSEYLNASNTSFSISENGDGTYRIDSLVKVDPMVVHFDLWYGYNITNSGVEVVFSTERTVVCDHKISHEFRLILAMQTTEDAPNPINNVNDLLSMYEGENYILMEDLTLENWSPINTAIASLDGNGKVINIKSFNITTTSSVNAGLFAEVSENTILKNIVVNIATMDTNVLYIKDDNVPTSTVNFGLLAGVNNGLIYNCEVVSISSPKTLEVAVGSGYSLTFGGLVGVNNGNITNSRVGTEYFERLTYAEGTVSSSIIRCGQLYFKAKGIVAGFVGVNNNNCVISSSFVANTSVENTSNIGTSERNRTAGFVATNNGMVAYSYVKGLESNILTTKSTTNSTKTGGAECVILASGAGSVAGFAYYNGGEIHDCYSNTVCISISAGVAGFVYDTTVGKTYQCYSATKVDSGLDSNALATEMPFVGVGIDEGNAQQLLSNEYMLNCYYFDDGVTEFDNVVTDRVKPKALSLESFANASNLNNFSFIANANTEQQLNGVWTHSTAVDRNRSTYPLSSLALPELTSANTISRSIRVFADVQNDSELKNYKYPLGYELGSKNNPYIIRNVEEYKNVFIDRASITTDNKKYNTGYVRFIDDISFQVDSEYINIDTRSNYILGDKNNKTFTLVDGNGMTISGVVINYSEEEKGNLGLFSEVYNSVIKGLNIKYANQTNSDGNEVGSSTASYVGGVAGVAKNTYFIDLSLSGGVTLRAHNVVGGVVGRLTGTNSGLYNITSDLNVQAGNYTNGNLYSGEDSEIAYLSYAGGIAGIVDIGANSTDDEIYNLNKLTVTSSNVRANRAGGIAGFMGVNVNAERLIYVISNTSQILGREVAGGLIADNLADIKLSQVSYANNSQHNYDKKFAEYINNSELLEIDNSEYAYGNLNAITGDEIVGGFIGVNYDGDVSNSLTKANIGHNNDYGMANVAGGFIGRTYGGNLEYVYAQNYIDLIYTISNADGGTYLDKTNTVGGLIGEVAYDTTDISENNKSKLLGLSNVVANNWFDKTQLNTLTKNVEYIAGSVDSNVKLCKNTTSPNSDAIISYGVFNADINDESQYINGKVANTSVHEANYYDMEALYYVATGNDSTGYSTQQDIFNSLFAIWPDEYWNKIYTEFMPTIKDDDATDYITIENEKDLNLMEQFPDRNFVLINDVDITKESNYVVNANFKGILIGTKLEGSETYTKFNIRLNANTSRDEGAGFFKQTTGAKIANIGFNYLDTGLNLAGNGEYSMVGGVSAIDNASRFEQVKVAGKIATKDSSVATIGSIVGEGKQSNIISCESSVDFNLSVKEVAINNAPQAYIGGLAGKLNGYKYDEQDGIVRYEGLISSSVYSGSITVQSTEGLNIGGVVASAEYSRISDCKVVNYNEDTKVNDPVNIYVDSVADNNIGGIAGVYKNCSIAYAYSNITLVDREGTTIDGVTVDTTYNVGGIAGRVNNESKMDKDIEDSYAKVLYSVDRANNSYIGGVIGNKVTNYNVNLNRLLTEVIVSKTEQDIRVSNMVVGGIVGLASGNLQSIVTTNEFGTNITESMAILTVDAHYSLSLIGGGLIGKTLDSYSINNSTSMGYIWANNSDAEGSDIANKSTLTILGGLVGLADDVTANVFTNKTISQQINNCYTTLTLSTAGVYQGDVVDGETYTHQVITNAVVGYTSSKNIVLGKGVLYSSDYNLTLDEDVNYQNQPVNVTANVILINDLLKPTTYNMDIDAGIYNGFIGDKWLWKNDILPMPIAVQDMLEGIGIITYNESAQVVFNTANKGKFYYPVMVDKESFADIEFNNVEYTYYLVADDLNVTTPIASLNGVVLGNNSVTNSTSVMFKEITKHSAITNISFIAKENSFINNTSEAFVANKNYGTIFMVGVQYDDFTIVDGFAGIASENYGLIEYSYNMGNATQVNGNVAGLAYINGENASIINSYFTGSFVGGIEGSALVFTNAGYIFNSYTAGQASKIINTDNSGRYEDVYYDYYANYVTQDDYQTYQNKGIIGLSTIETALVEGDKTTYGLQTYINNTNSKLFEGWKIYSIYNWEKFSGNSDENVYTTYNYGYPIHNISQLTYVGSTQLTQIPIRVKQTGNGTFDIIKNGDNVVTDVTDEGRVYLANNTKGKLVVNELEDGSKEFYDNRSFLINSLGVLSLINTLSDTEGLYFELEVDMTLPTNNNFKENDNDDYKLLSNWKGLGTTTNPFKGVFSSTAQVDETIVNNVGIDLYKLDRTLLSEYIDEKFNINFYHEALIVSNSTPKTITNLTGGALFACVDNGAVIVNIALKDSKVNSAPLIDFVGGQVENEEGSRYVPTVYRVKIVNSVIANSKSVSGLVNKVDTQLNIHSIDFGDIKLVAYKQQSALETSSVAGAINTNNGVINVKESFTGTQITFEEATGVDVAGFIKNNNKNASINLANAISIEIISESVNQNTVTGLAYENAGSILTVGESGGNSTIKLTTVAPTKTWIAGLVGTMRGGVVAGFNIEFVSEEVDAYETENLFGGVVVKLVSGQIGIKEDKDAQIEEKSVTVKLTTAVARVFGGVIAEVDKTGNEMLNNGSIACVEIIQSSESIVVKGKKDEGCAYGLVIGKYTTKLAEINYTLQASENIFKVHNGINVGGVIGLAKNGTFNFTNEMPNMTFVYGFNTVGGFIGRYEGDASITMEGTTWAIGGNTEDEGYAQVEIASPEAPKDNTSQVSVVTSENFGGLIGFWNTKTTLQAIQVEKKDGENAEGDEVLSEKPILIINKNIVLSFAKEQGKIEFDWYRNLDEKTGYDIILSNIGGVVGKSNASISSAQNNALVGFAITKENLHEGGNNKISGTDLNDLNNETSINEIMQFMYIGGVVGFATDAGENPNLQIIDCANNGNISGMYAVGGIIGGTSDEKVTITDTFDSMIKDKTGANIVGLSDVGGLMGLSNKFNYNCEAVASEGGKTTFATTTSFGNVTGITNVGGIIGNATMADIQNAILNSEEFTRYSRVTGNINVGGFIGLATKINMHNCQIAGTAIYGTIFDYKYKDIESEEYEAYYYLPTNIGGVVGYASAVSTFNLVETKAEVRTDANFKIGEINECTVNMSFNYIGKNVDRTQYLIPNTKFTKYLENYYGKNKERYDAVDGGIGGFAGRVNSEVTQNEIQTPQFTDCYVYGDVNAYYGINVGGMIGYLNCDPQLIQLPKVKSEPDTLSINVAGKIFVGGYIGKCLSFSSDQGGDFFDTNLNIVSNINVQQYVKLDKDGNKITYKVDEVDIPETDIMVGNCVGGVIGYVTGNVYNIKLGAGAVSGGKSKIKVFNSNNSYADSIYVGALVGRIDGNMLGCEVAANLCDASDADYGAFNYKYGSEGYMVQGIIQSPTIYNYGGLVGLANVASGAKGDNKLQILGKHYYPFTVDMVQNRDYVQGVTDYEYSSDDDSNQLTLVAHYINTSDIQISVSLLTDLYNNDNDNHNPVLGKVKNGEKGSGWAKEYTLFRTFARVCNQPNEPTGDSIQVIYDADCVIGVHTVYHTYDGNGFKEYPYNIDIVYTIYQPIGQTARMYTKYGIATLAEDFNPEEDTLIKSSDNFIEKLFGHDDKSYEFNYSLTIDSTGQWVSNSGVNRKAFWHHIVNPADLGVTATLQDGKVVINEDVDEEVETVATALQYTFGYSYYKVDDDYYVFDSVFGRLEFEGIDSGGVIIPETKEDPRCYSKSGSIFEVTGTVSPTQVGKVEDGQKWLKVALEVTIDLALLVGMLFTGGASGGVIVAKSAAKAGIKAIAKGVAKITAKIASKKLAALAVSAMIAVTTVNMGTQVVTQIVNMSTVYVEASYGDLQDVSMGYLTNNYARSISWKDGEMNETTDTYLPLPMTVKLNMAEGKTLNKDIILNGNYTKYEKYIVDNLIYEEDGTAIITLIYYNCSTSRVNPGDINEKVNVLVSDMVGDEDSNVLKKILTALGVTSYSVPKYYISGDELYAYSNQVVTSRQLMPNYEYVTDEENGPQITVASYAIINDGGYAYLLITENNTYGNYIVPQEQETYLRENYDLERTINQSLKVKISNSSGGSIKKVDLSTLRWRVTDQDYSAYAGSLQVEKQFKYVGINTPQEESIARQALQDVDGNVYYNDNNGNWVNVATGAILTDTANTTSVTAYFTLSGTGVAGFTVKLIPFVSTSGIRATELGISGDYYYQYSNSSYLQIPCQFGLCSEFKSNIDAESEDGLSYIYGAPFNEYDLQLKTKLYRFDPNPATIEGAESFFEEVGEFDFSEIQADFNAYKDYSLSNASLEKVGDRYALNGNGKLCTKTLNPLYFVDIQKSGREVKYIYIPEYDSLEMESNFANRYVYTVTINGKAVKLYTRFKYDGYGADIFVDHSVGGRTIKEILFPTSVVGVSYKNIVLNESCRVTLSCAGQSICYGYATDGFSDPMTNGKIEADCSAIL